MGRLEGGLKTALWSAVFVAGVFALWMQGTAAHRENLELQARIRVLDREIADREARIRELRELKADLQEDPYAVERALRDMQTAGEERLLPVETER